MTDDELERALFALPLEEPPANLRARILAATIERPRLTFAAWEIWMVGTVTAFMVWLAVLVATSVPDIGGAIVQTVSYGIDRFAGTISPAALVWIGVGVSFAIWMSAFSRPSARRRIADR